MKNDAKKYSLNVSILLCLLLFNSCTKLEKVSSVSTGYVTDRQSNAVEVSGTIIDLGEGATGYGFCYGKKPNVTLANKITMLGVPLETGDFKGNIPDLDAGTTYYYKAYLSNGSGIVFGKELSFITFKASLPSIFTKNISGITSISAGSGGGVTSDGGSEIVASGVCWSLNQDPSQNDAHTSDTLIQGVFSSSITGLSPARNYFVRAYAINAAGIAYGNQLKFATEADIPKVITVFPESITSTTAVSGGNVLDDQGSVVINRGVCYNTTGNPCILDTKTSDGSGIGVFTSSLEGLTPNTEYFVRAYAINSIDTAYGNELTFTTINTSSTLPSSTLSNVTNVTNTSATVSGAVLANGSYTKVVIEYGVSGQFPFSVSAVPDTISGTSITIVNAELIALTPGTLYSVRIKAVNEAGTSYSNILTFITTQMAFAETKTATEITKNSAKLNGSVNSFNASTTVTFQYGLTVSYGYNVTASQSPVTGSTVTDVNATIYDLSRDCTYHFRIKAENSGGTTYGDDKTFITSK